MRRRERKSKNINTVDVFKGLWVRPMRMDVAKQLSEGLWVRQLRKDVAKQPSAKYNF